MKLIFERGAELRLTDPEEVVTPLSQVFDDLTYFSVVDAYDDIARPYYAADDLLLSELEGSVSEACFSGVFACIRAWCPDEAPDY